MISTRRSESAPESDWIEPAELPSVEGSVLEPKHAVQFYESDADLCEVVGDFLALGLADGGSAVVIATEAHRRDFSAHLGANGLDVEGARATGQLVLLDAAETLSKFMVGEQPDWTLFKNAVGPVLHRGAQRPGGQGILRAYGEMVDLLWKRANHSAAIRLEEMWNELQRLQPFSLLCAYEVASFFKEPASLHRICGVHSQVGAPAVLGEPGGTLVSPKALRALAVEIARRKEVEGALRDTLRELRRKTEALEESRARAELLYGLAAAVIGADNVEEVFKAALDAIERALGTNRAAILVFDEDGVMRFRDWRHLSDGYRQAVEGHSPWSREVRDPRPVVIEDVDTDPGLAAFGALFHNERIGALAFIPLVFGGRLMGKFMVYYPQPRELASQEVEMATAIANHVAAGISRFSSVAELQRTVRFNELFTGILGHDLRNPLAAIITAARMAMSRAESEPILKALSRILGSGDRMSRMINQLLDFTRVRVGTGIPLTRAELDVVPLIRQVMDELDDANPDWTLRLVAQGDAWGRWDGDRLCQVFSNLVANAVHHGRPDAGVEVTVDGRASDFVRFEVRNGGVVAPELLSRLFEPLAGGERRPQTSRGLGLGLFITRELVRAHGGQIAVASDDANGTVFTVELPRGNHDGPSRR